MAGGPPAPHICLEFAERPRSSAAQHEVSHAWCEMAEALVFQRETLTPSPSPGRKERGDDGGALGETWRHCVDFGTRIQVTSPSPAARERDWGEGSPALALTLEVFRARHSRRRSRHDEIGRRGHLHRNALWLGVPSTRGFCTLLPEGGGKAAGCGLLHEDDAPTSVIRD